MAVLLDDPALTRILLSYATGIDPAFVAKIRSFYDGVKVMLSDEPRRGAAPRASSPPATRSSSPPSRSARSRSCSPRTWTGETPLAREEIVDALFCFLQAGYLRTGGKPAQAGKAEAMTRASPEGGAKRARRS